MGAGVAGLNGKTGEVLRWVIGGIVTVLISYYSAQQATSNRIASVEATIGKVESKVESNFGELQRTLGRIETDIRELRGEVRAQ